jgi:hypothetical protein
MAPNRPAVLTRAIGLSTCCGRGACRCFWRSRFRMFELRLILALRYQSVRSSAGPKANQRFDAKESEEAASVSFMNFRRSSKYPLMSLISSLQ